MQNRDFLGKDTKFPITDKFSPVKGIDTVIQDLQILIATVPGERVMRPDYGCNLYTRIWDNIDDVAIQGLTDIREAVNSYEPRVNLIQVAVVVNRDLGSLQFTVTFTIKGENNPQNLVFPFQLNNNV